MRDLAPEQVLPEGSIEKVSQSQQTPRSNVQSVWDITERAPSSEPSLDRTPADARPVRAPGVRFRQIDSGDLAAVADLLRRGFPLRDRRYWVAALQYLKDRPAPEGFPRYGYMLSRSGEPVGVLLLIYSAATDGNLSSVRCNLSSWYVDPEVRHLAPLLIQPLLRQSQVTFVNTSPAENTLPVIEAQGFRRFCGGTFLSVPALTKRRADVRFVDWRKVSYPADLLPAHEVAMLQVHEARGCICVVLRDEEGGHPFVFRRRRVRYRLRVAWVPCAQLIYTRDLNTMARFAGNLGRYLALRGMLLVLIGANGKIAEVPGSYFEGRGAMYSRGPEVPRLGDLTFTEGALFGV